VSSTTLGCDVCGLIRRAGELLVVRDVAGVELERTICRPMVRSRCFETIGPAARWSIALVDVDDSRRVDVEAAAAIEARPRGAFQPGPGASEARSAPDLTGAEARAQQEQLSPGASTSRAATA
jgi:hypothetical protein